MEMGDNFCQILELGGGLLLRDGEYLRKYSPPEKNLYATCVYR